MMKISHSEIEAQDWTKYEDTDMSCVRSRLGGTDMNPEEIEDLKGLINRSRPPRDGMEIHFLRVLEGTAMACTSKENEWLQWALSNDNRVPLQLPAAEVPHYTEVGIADSPIHTGRHQKTDIPEEHQTIEDASQEDQQKANSFLERICRADFSCIRELSEQRNPVVFELLNRQIRERLKASPSREIRERMVRAQRKIYEVEHNTVLPDGGSIVNWGGLHDLRTWNW